jgi:cell shape-determining protein MreC
MSADMFNDIIKKAECIARPEQTVNKIEALEAEVKRLRDALKFIADCPTTTTIPSVLTLDGDSAKLLARVALEEK